MQTSIFNESELNDHKKDESDEDKNLQDELNMIIARLQESYSPLHLSALESLKQLIKSSTTSITSIPKPLKYMKQHYETMKNIHNKACDKTIKERLADIISVLAMTMDDDDNNTKDCLLYRLLADPKIEICSWGHEYVRYLASEIALVWMNCSENDKHKIMSLIEQILPFTLNHNAEIEACDLLMEIEKLDFLLNYIDENSYPKIFLYLISCIPYVSEPENITLSKFACKIAMQHEKYIEAVRIALMMNDHETVMNIFEKCTDPLMKNQIGFIIARQRFTIDFSNFDEKNTEIISNMFLNQYFKNLVRDLDIMEAKCPEDVYKTHFDSNKILHIHADSARYNLAASIVNGFINTGFGNDKILEESGGLWIYKNKEHAMLSATASLGLINLWDIDNGLSIIDKYLYSTDNNIKAGALLACGIISCGIRNDVEPAHALLSDYLWNENILIRSCAILGIGIAYAGTNSSLALNSLRSLLHKFENNIDITGTLAISIGLIAVGTCNTEDTKLLFEQAVWCDKSSEQSPYVRVIFLALGLLYLGRQSQCEALLEDLQVLHEPFKSYGIVMVEMCAYAGTGNVLKIQHFLHICLEHINRENNKSNKKEKKLNKKFDFTEVQMVAVIGIALISMGDEVSVEMSLRIFSDLTQYGDPEIRRAVPLAVALCHISNPKAKVADMLNKFSHDNDTEVTLNSIFALGLIAAGTNNAKVANILRQLSQYYAQENKILFIIRLAQGLTHLAKGTVTLSPYHSDHLILRPSSIAALLNIIFVCLDLKNSVLGAAHYLLYTITPAIDPRFLMTLDENFDQIHVPIRVGTAVDIVAQAGKPKIMTAFQTNTTPILLGVGERAELATEDYISMSPILEGIVILKKKE